MEFLWQIFEWNNLIALSFGVFIGIVVGALPGLTPTMGVALTIPFTFSLGPTEGLIILGGIFCGSVYGGSIPAILFNVPGAPANVATTFDGYPMSKQGRTRKALELTTISSVVGGLFGMLILLFFAPIFAEFSLEFGPSENFWVAIFGLTVIAAISEGTISKNLIGGGIGVLLSFIGISTVTGTARFTFGMESFIGGLNVVAVLIALFAFPQALRLIEGLSSKNQTHVQKWKMEKSTIRESFGEVLKKPKSVSLGSTIGAIIGVIPGAGGNIASIIAYGEAKRFAKNKENFGKGEKQGIIASESANNAMVGGALIPLLTLGIPGSPTAAIFLGGLLIHGIWPGRNLFVDNAGVAYTFLYSMVAAQILLLFLGLLLIKHMTKLSHIPPYIMAPVILSFSIIGAYTMQNSLFDVYTVIVIGLIMFVLQKLDFSAAPIALGFILGPIAEEGLLQGIQVGAAKGATFSYFFTGAWNIGLFTLVFLTVTFALMNGIKGKSGNETLRSKIAWKNLFSWTSLCWLFTGLLTISSIVFVDRLEPMQKIMPKMTLIFMFILIVFEYLKNLRIKNEVRSVGEKFPLSVYLFIGVISIIGLLIGVIGFYAQVFILMISVPLYVYLKKCATVRLLKTCVVAISFTFILYFVFTIIVKVPLPASSLFYF
ncbi:tripartite tricarboxylate transporter permease [Aquibacillus sp. 3ASR75-11]|uniref:Tripartite tricarboxylate transporter permease n=1 Tax=Terrihalobacillus insolitus TaxID=2950438 RepID=A0A9X3WWT8_9BACI|nr:tripartite tricarboxylate transporter permease [Terrihalobacillus insolitus]MDC3415222.1 tripartite tricarboxylate transporter permease [Terrihalobacillus insolitus]MDC3426238.1 tripartite tricarboxylate transporter permease [Terrihalobacillus insolitus]